MLGKTWHWVSSLLCIMKKSCQACVEKLPTPTEVTTIYNEETATPLFWPRHVKEEIRTLCALWLNVELTAIFCQSTKIVHCTLQNSVTMCLCTNCWRAIWKRKCQVNVPWRSQRERMAVYLSHHIWNSLCRKNVQKRLSCWVALLSRTCI